MSPRAVERHLSITVTVNVQGELAARLAALAEQLDMTPGEIIAELTDRCVTGGLVEAALRHSAAKVVA